MSLNLVVLTDPASPAAEAYRQLRVNLMYAGRDQALRSVLVAAAGHHGEKARIVANLAVAFARVGKQVILVDGDLRHPEQHALFGLDNGMGLTTALAAVSAGQAAQPEGISGTMESAALPLQATQVSGLRLLTSGPVVQVPADLIASAGMRDLISRLRKEADIVLFDAPPVLLATDAAELATQVDGVLLTVCAGRTRRDEAARARDLLAQVGARLVGAALVNVTAHAKL